MKKKGLFTQRKTISIVSVILVGVIMTLVVLKQQNAEELLVTEEIQHEEQYVDALQQAYTIEREKRRKMLKLTEEKFNELGFVHAADSMISLLAQESYRENIMSNTNGKELLEGNLDRSISFLQLPSEMAEDISRTPLIDGELESISFLDSYRSKVQDLIATYDEILEESGSTAKSLAEAMALAEAMPLTKVMREQSIEFHSNRNTDEVKARYVVSALHQKVTDNVHSNTLGYVDMIAQEPYMYGASLQYSLEELIPMLQRMEKTLLTVDEEHALYPILKSYYVAIFNAIMTEAQSMKDFDERYKQSLRDLANSSEATLLAYVVQPIIEELEASDWRFSKRLDMLEWEDIVEALVLGRHQQLAYFMSEEYGKTTESPVQYSIVDTNFIASVHTLYTNFSKAHDEMLLMNASAVEVIGLYYYAEELQDFDTQYALLATEMYGDKETYKQTKIDNYQLNRKLAEDFMDITFLSNVEEEDNGFYAGSAVIGVRKIDDPLTEPKETIQLQNTKFGWRIVVLPKG